MVCRSNIYEELTSRNYLYISKRTQELVTKTKLLFLGSGLSSVIAHSCVRLGFLNINLNDGDCVELSNLNRQIFYFDDIGDYKVDVLKRHLMAINPECKVATNSNYINNLEDIRKQLDNSDIIINTIDCNHLYFEIIRYGMISKKLVIRPFNPGYDGFVLFFSEKSQFPDQIFNLDKKLDDIEISKQLFEKYSNLKTLSQAESTIDNFLKNASLKYFPQITIGAHLTCAITVTGILRFIEGEKIPLAPEPFHLSLS